MKNITFSADERMIQAARTRARKEQTTLNQKFRDWLADYAGECHDDSEKLMHDLKDTVRIGRTLSRDELNER